MSELPDLPPEASTWTFEELRDWANTRLLTDLYLRLDEYDQRVLGTPPLSVTNAAKMAERSWLEIELDRATRDVVCAHCHGLIPGPSRGGVGDNSYCHTGTLPPDDDPVDCYRLVTVYGHDPLGACCHHRYH